MLEGLDSIDWSTLRHAYGEASNVPRLLRSALSPDEKTRKEAIHWLFFTIYHQGSIYSSSPHAVPFLYEMLESDDAADKPLIAHVVAALANGYSDLLSASAVGPFSDWSIRKMVAERGEDWNAAVEREFEWVEQTWQAVAKKLELLYPFYLSADWEAREAMTLAFVKYPERARETLPLLRKGVAVEQKPWLRKLIKLAIKELQRRSSKL